MNRNDCKQVLFYAAEIFNERMGSTFNEENLVLSCFQTSNQQEVFEQFCKQYFSDRLTDRYKEEGYFDFHASAFIGEGKNSVDGILLRTDIERTPATLYHVLLHVLAHVFCAHNELGGDSFYKRYCMDSTLSREEDGAINAGYAIWRELIAEVIAFEMADNCFVVPLREKNALLQHYEEEFENGDRKRGITMILCEALTSKECEMSATWNVAQKKVAGHKPFDNPLFMDMLGLVFRKLRDAVICLKSWNRVTGELPPSCARSSTFPDGETSCPTPFWLMRSATALFMMHTRSSLTVKSPCGSARA